MKRISHHLIFIPVFTILLTACGGGSSESTATPSPVPTPTAGEPTPSPSPMPTQAPPTEIPTLSPTAPLIPTPDASACKLREASTHGGVGLGFPHYPVRLRSTGTVRAAVIFVDFEDAPATLTPEQVFEYISPEGEAFYEAVSYGRYDLQLDPHFEWLRMSEPSTDYNFSLFQTHREYIAEAIALADPAVDFSGAEAVVVLANPAAFALSYGPTLVPNAGGGFNVDGTQIDNAVTSGADLVNWGYGWLTHEGGHMLGLSDLYAFDHDPANYDTQHRHVGGFGFMGYIDGLAPEPFAYERWLLGWLDDEQILCQQVRTQITELTAVEVEGGVKAVIIPISDTLAVVIESRRALGYDSELPEEGVLVYTVDTSINTGNGPIRVEPIKPGDPYRYQSLLAAGEALTVDRVTINVLESTAEGDTVQVTVRE